MDKSGFATLVADTLIPRDPTARILEIYRAPPGRGVSADRRALADWLNALGDEDRARIAFLMADQRHAAVFSMLVMLDDGTQYRDGEEVGTLRLEYHAKDGTITHLNDFKGEDLHDLFNQAIEDRPGQVGDAG